LAEFRSHNFRRLLVSDVQHWLGFTAPSFPGSKFIPAILGTVVFVYGGLVFIRGASSELADHKPGMMTLISVAIIVAFGTSLAATFGLFEVDVWWELASLITIMVLGHWLEMRAISQARGALNALATLLPDAAERVTGAETQVVPLSDLRIGDIALVRPGARVPADGTVVEGAADVDESMMTGESKPLPKAAGSKVIAGTVVSGGSLASVFWQSGTRPLFPESCGSSPPRKRPALARRHLPTGGRDPLLRRGRLGRITFAYWWFSGDKEHALIRTATVLVIACPHALGLAIPLVIAISTSLGAQNGLLVKDRLASNAPAIWIWSFSIRPEP
jgi:Cation transport ATPase